MLGPVAIVVALASLLLFAFGSVVRRRRAARRAAEQTERLAAFEQHALRMLGQRWPDWQPVREKAGDLLFRGPGGEERLVALAPLLARADDEEASWRLLRAAAAVAETGLAPFDRPLDLKADGRSVLPLLISGDLLEGLPPDLPHSAVGESGLVAIYLVERHPVERHQDERQAANDEEQAESAERRYLSRDRLDELDLDTGAVHDLSLANLRQRFDGEPVRRALAGEVIRVGVEDAFTASRLLLVPELLAEGEELVAAVPGGAILLLAPREQEEALATAAETRPPPNRPLLAPLLLIDRESIRRLAG